MTRAQRRAYNQVLANPRANRQASWGNNTQQYLARGTYEHGTEYRGSTATREQATAGGQNFGDREKRRYEIRVAFGAKF